MANSQILSGLAAVHQAILWQVTCQTLLESTTNETHHTWIWFSSLRLGNKGGVRSAFIGSYTAVWIHSILAFLVQLLQLY